jgi:hypothetical protein
LIEARQDKNLAAPQPRKAQVMLKFLTVAVVAAFVSTSAIAAPASRIANYSSTVTKVGCGVDNRPECCVSDANQRRTAYCR